jgi:hypothetical protein
MYKKLLMACMALSAFVALAVPAIASAGPVVTAPTGTNLAAGSPIEAKNVGELLMTDVNGNVLTECNSATMSGTLKTNSGTTVEGNVESAAFTGHATNGECTGSFGNVTVTANPATNGLPWCLRATSTMKADEFQLRGNSCSSAARPIRFVLHSTTVGECVYQRSGAVVGEYKTHPSAAQLTVVKQEFTRFSGSFLCPSAGYLDMTFNLTTNGNSVWVD